jgi:pimeloyl-ACP methyl ester carboxylesterase
MKKPILVGNSCGGDILHALGAQHPERLGGLVYLDAAEDPTLKASDYPHIPVDMAHMPTMLQRAQA